MLLAVAIASGCGKDNDTGNPGNLTLGLHVEDGKYLAEDCGNKVVLRGVNMGNVYAVNFGATELGEIEKTGANSVRIVLKRM